MTQIIQHRPKCKKCGNVFFLQLDKHQDWRFKQIMESLGWSQNKKKEWTCPDCEE